MRRARDTYALCTSELRAENADLKARLDDLEKAAGSPVAAQGEAE